MHVLLQIGTIYLVLVLVVSCWLAPGRRGCAGAGMMWLWDLSATLGFAAAGSPGGSWLTSSTPYPYQARLGSI